MFRTLLLAISALALVVVVGETALLGTDLKELAEAEQVLAREAQFYLQRAYPFKNIPPGARLRALEQLERGVKLRALGIEPTRQWVSIGPNSVPNGQPLDLENSPRIPVSGRATAVVIDPNNPSTIFLGTAQGGVWRSMDAGANWQPLTDKLQSLAVGALAMDPRDSNVIFLGTGEAHFSRDSYYGAGVFKSTDGGNTWAQAGELPMRARVSRIVFDPSNSQTVYVTTTSAASESLTDIGVFKSTNGGASWQKSLNGVATDLVIDPITPANLIAALGDIRGDNTNGVYRSTDAGASWQLITALPAGNAAGRIQLARAASSPNIVFASVARPDLVGLLNLFRSNDGGSTWTVVRGAPDYCGRQCFYNNFLAIHPTDPSLVFLGGTPLYRSTDGGNTYIDISSAQQFGPGLHADNQAMAFDPHSRNTIYVVNDGGIFRSPDLGNSWTPLNQGLSTFQFVSVASDPASSQRSIGGTQDNGTLLYTGSPDWRQIDLGDGAETAIDPNKPDTLYHFYFFLLFARSDNGGGSFVLKISGLPVASNGFTLERALFYAPLEMDPVTTTTLYTGSIRLFRTTNRGELWLPVSGDLTKGTGAISAISVARSDPRVIYVGTSDGNVARTTDGGTSWQPINAGLPNRSVSRFAIDPSTPQVAYVAFSGFDAGHVYKTSNGGESWVDVSDNLPDVPVNAIALDTVAPNTIYLATDIGVFISRTGGGDWRVLNSGLPIVAVFDLDLNRQTGTLIAATHGRGMFALPLDGNDDNTAPQVAVQSPAGGEVFKAGDVVAIRWSATDDTGVLTQNIDLSLDGGATFSVPIASGLTGETRSFDWHVPELATTQARIRVSARDEVGNVGVGVNAADFTIAVPPRLVIARIQFKSGGNGKLLVDGDGFIVDDSVIEVEGRQLETTKYPKPFRLPNGMTTRLQGLDNQLKQLIQPGRKVSISVLNKSTGQRSTPFEFTP